MLQAGCDTNSLNFSEGFIKEQALAGE